MALAEFLAELDALAEQGVAALEAAADAPSLESARVCFLGAKSGRLKDVQKGLGGVAKADKPVAGKRFNEVKQAIEAAFESAKQRLTTIAGPAVEVRRFDPTVPGARVRIGRLHPITQTIEELKEIMGRLGFTAVELALSELLGRRVDLNTEGFLSKYFRDEVLAEAETLYGSG